LVVGTAIYKLDGNDGSIGADGWMEGRIQHSFSVGDFGISLDEAGTFYKNK
jgi:hypothetical protein